MKPIEIYFRSMLSTAIVLLTFGVVAPWLVSAASDFAVIAGFILVIGVVPLVWWLFGPVIKLATTETKEQSDNEIT